MGILDILRRPFEPEGDLAVRLLASPEPVSSKVGHLSDLANRLRAAQAATATELRELHAERRALEGRLREQREITAHQPAYTGLTARERQAGWIEVPSAPDPGNIAHTEARLAVVTRAIARLQPQAEAGAARADAAGRLADRCIEWTRPRSPADLQAAVTRAGEMVAPLTMSRGSTRLASDLEKCRGELAALAEERKALASTPVALDEARARALAVVDGAMAEWEGFAVGRFFAADYDPSFEQGSGVVPSAQNPDQVRGFIVHLLAEQLKTTLGEALEREAARCGRTLSTEERERRVAEVDRKIRSAWYREEALCIALEAVGVAVDRREDADPEVALTVALPEAGAGAG